jgi:hypothetical protein
MNILPRTRNIGACIQLISATVKLSRLFSEDPEEYFIRGLESKSFSWPVIKAIHGLLDVFPFNRLKI